MTTVELSEIMKRQHDDTMEFIKLNNSAVKAEIQSSHDILYFEIRKTQEKQDKTNGKVLCLENETKFARLIQEHPKISFAVAIIFIFIIGVLGANGVIKLIQSLV